MPTAGRPRQHKQTTEPRPELVRSDLNLEKWPVYVPSDSRSKPQARVFERETTLEDGRQVTASVKVGYTDLGMLITDDQKVLCGLLKLWEQDGRPEILRFSLRRLADALKRKWNGKVAQALSDSLMRLRQTPFVWTNAYMDAAACETIRLLKTFTILDDLEVAERAVHGHTTKQSCTCRFHPLIDQNIRLNHSKPILYDTIIAFESGVAQLLYRHVDLILYGKTRYVRRSRELFEDIGLQGDEYRFVSRRRRTLERAFRELEGAALTSGVVHVRLEPTKDGKDLNAVFTKTVPGGPRVLGAIDETTGDGSSEGDDLAFRREAAARVVRRFYEAFHQHDAVDLTTKELEQAAQLVDRYGVDIALHVVDYARAQAGLFKAQAFGFVFAYADRARRLRTTNGEGGDTRHDGVRDM